MNNRDYEILRKLAGEYTEVALDDGIRERERRCRRHIGLEIVRPLVNIFEVPWGELENDPKLRLQCEDPRCKELEKRLRRVLYQKKYFMADYMLPPYISVPVLLEGTGYGIATSETIIHSDTGSDVSSHSYNDLLPDIESLEKINTKPHVSINREETDANIALAEKVFDGLMKVKQGGVELYSAMWDIIPLLHGPNNVINDLIDNPEYCHTIIDKFTTYFENLHAEYERLNVLEPELYYLHCTPALTDELPQKDFDGVHVRRKDIWARGMAQLFAVVSPDMHDEFDLQYMQRIFDVCGLSYYGCCEPLDRKIPYLRKRFKNLRKISITPWADKNIAAENIGSDYVFSLKPNPAFVAGTFDPEPVKREITEAVEACLRNKTPLEIILKDISTIGGNVNNLTLWAKAVNEVLDIYY